MQGHIRKWGNSLGLRIPMRLAKQLHISSGSIVTLEIDNGRIIIQPPKYDLEAMLKEITPKNQHNLLFDDDQTGNEEW